MIPPQWTFPCNNQCTNKYAALTQIPWRVFCKKGCDADGESWEECLGECSEICYKDPVFKDKQWSAYIDRSPGAATYSEHWKPKMGPAQVHELLIELESGLRAQQLSDFQIWKPYNLGSFLSQECFYACVSGCGFKFGIHPDEVNQVRPNRPLKPPPVQKPAPPTVKPGTTTEDIPCTSA